MAKKYFYIYKITNIINNKIYIGAHSANKIDDNYMGSGTLLKRAIRKYGIDSFKREVIKFCSNEKEMFNEEAAIVDQNFIEREDTYNCKLGGFGGTEQSSKVKELLSQKALENKIEGKGCWSKEAKEKLREYYKSEKGSENIRKSGLLGCSKEAAKKRLDTLSKSGYFLRGSPNLGTKWITNGIENRMIPKEEIPPEGFYEGITRKKKNSKVYYGKEANNYGKKLYTNGINNILLKEQDVIPEGYYKGKTYKNKKKSKLSN